MRPSHPASRALVVLAITLLVMVLNVAASVLYMIVYGHVIAPGHDDAHYRAHAAIAAPYSSVIVGIPLVFFAARWIARRHGVVAGLAVAWLYIAIDAVIVVAVGALGRLAVVLVLSYATKLAAAWAGARSGHSRA